MTLSSVKVPSAVVIFFPNTSVVPYTLWAKSLVTAICSLLYKKSFVPSAMRMSNIFMKHESANIALALYLVPSSVSYLLLINKII